MTDPKIIPFKNRGPRPGQSPLAAEDSPRHGGSRRGEPRDMIEAMLDNPGDGDTPPALGQSTMQEKES